jgi:hypothetical protein
MELKDKFWKFASTSNATDTLENIFIKWAGKEQITINEFNSTYAEINNQVNEFFGKTASFYSNKKNVDYYCNSNAPPFYKLYSQLIFYA